MGCPAFDRKSDGEKMMDRAIELASDHGIGFGRTA